MTVNEFMQSYSLRPTQKKLLVRAQRPMMAESADFVLKHLLDVICVSTCNPTAAKQALYHCESQTFHGPQGYGTT